MKKTVLTFGFISGGILAAVMVLTFLFKDWISLDYGAVVGYTAMVIAFLLIFFGVRSYRDDVAGGTVGFGRALAVGALIAAVASTCYVAAWEVIFYGFEPDYIQKYEAHALDKARAKGATPAALAQQKAKLDSYAEYYKNPVTNAAVTFLEPLPVALLFVLVSAGALSRKKKEFSTADGSIADGRTSN